MSELSLTSSALTDDERPTSPPSLLVPSSINNNRYDELPALPAGGNLTSNQLTVPTRPALQSSNSASKTLPTPLNDKPRPPRKLPPFLHHSTRSASMQQSTVGPPVMKHPRRAASMEFVRPSRDPAMNVPVADYPLPILPTEFRSLEKGISGGVAQKSDQSSSRRRWYALMELMSTEEGYVNDLKILVNTYLDQLPSVTSLDGEALRKVSRNAKDLLEFHQTTLQTLRRISSDECIQDIRPDVLSPDTDRRVDNAIRRMAAIFIKEGPSFHLYEEFCSGHPEALDVIRKVQSLPEWDMFERRCAVVAADELSDERVKGTAPVHVRRHSTDDPKAARDLPRISKLTMRDFLIKPVQRICRYPLILQQLQSDNVPSSPTSSSRIYGENITSQALEAMKIVAAKVDEARRKTDIATKTRLIVERVSEEELPSLHSMGNCLLAGSLDVVYHHEIHAPLAAPVKVKYLGAFVYLGWILMVKVSKNKVYEPRYWFPLNNVEVVDINEDDSLLPASFRISSSGHHFELAAACQKEKALWMTAIEEARAKTLPEPKDLPSSLIVEETPQKPSIVVVDQSLRKRASRRSIMPFDLDSAFSTSSSRPISRVLFDGDVRQSSEQKPQNNADKMPFQLKDLFSGESSTILIRRVSATHRILVDRGLSDVYSDICLTVRLQSQAKEPLFRPPRLVTTPSSSIVTTSKSSRRESVIIRRQRSLMDSTGQPALLPTSKSSSSSKFALSRTKSLSQSAKDLRRKTLAIPSFSFFEEKEQADRPDLTHSNTTCSSPTSSLPASPLTNMYGEDVASNEVFEEALEITFGRRSKDQPQHRPPRRAQTMYVSRTVGNDSKDLPPVPPIRASTLHGVSNHKKDPIPPPLPETDNAPKHPPSDTIYAVGAGLSNVNPKPPTKGKWKRSSGSNFLQKSLTLIVPRTTYVTSLFSRSTTHIASPETESIPYSRAHSEPHSTFVLSSPSAPMLNDNMSAWELVPNITVDKSWDPTISDKFHLSSTEGSSTASDEIPPVPPLTNTKLRHQKSLGQKRTSRFITPLHSFTPFTLLRDS